MLTTSADTYVQQQSQAQQQQQAYAAYASATASGSGGNSENQSSSNNNSGGNQESTGEYTSQTSASRALGIAHRKDPVEALRSKPPVLAQLATLLRVLRREFWGVG